MTSENLESRLSKLEARHEKTAARARRVKDILEIINLQSRFNLWLEQGSYERIWNELFAHDDPRVSFEIGGSGVYRGPESVRNIWAALAARNRPRGHMSIIMPMSPCIVVSPDGKTAKGMWPAFGPHADYVTPSPGDQQKLTAYWLFGKYDNEFVKEDGRWKFLSLRNIVYIRTPYHQGWLKEADCAPWQEPEEFPPDELPVSLDIYHPDGVFYPLPAPPEPED